MSRPQPTARRPTSSVGSPLEGKSLLSTSVCTVARCWSWTLSVTVGMVPRCLAPFEAFPTLLVIHCDESLLELDGCDPKWLVPLSGSPSELVGREKAICRGVAWSAACLVSGLVGVQRGLWTLEEDLAKEFVQVGDRTDGSTVRWG